MVAGAGRGLGHQRSWAFPALLELPHQLAQLSPFWGADPANGKTRKRRAAKSGGLKPIAPGNNLEFAANGFLNINDRSNLEYERRKHRAEFVDGHQIVTFH